MSVLSAVCRFYHDTRTMGNDTAIVLHPAIQFYRTAIAQLQHELRELLYRWYELVVEERPRVLERYAELFGELERTLQVETLRTAQVQRICELVHLYVRRGEVITPSLLQRICQLVERQHRQYRMHNQPSSPRAHSSGSSPAEDAQMPARSRLCAQFYRDLVKRLHPDREGDTTLFERFWDIVQDAYRRGDLERLRTIHGIVCIDAQYQTSDCCSVESLVNTHRRLVYRIEYEQRRLRRMRSQEPLAIAMQLDDAAWIAQHRASIEQQIERQRHAARLAAEELLRCGAKQWEEHLRSATNESVPDDVFQDEFFKNTYFSMRS